MRSDFPQDAHADHGSSPPASLPTEHRALLDGIGGLAASALLARSRTAHAGLLNPPAGPVVSTGKAHIEVEPRITINSTNTFGDANLVFRITTAATTLSTTELCANFAF